VVPIRVDPGEVVVSAELEHGRLREAPFQVRPGDTHLEVVESLAVPRRPVVVEDLSGVHPARHELADPVAVDVATRKVRDPFARREIELRFALWAGAVERPVRPRADDPDLLAGLGGGLPLKHRRTPKRDAGQRPVPLVGSLVDLINSIAWNRGVRAPSPAPRVTPRPAASQHVNTVDMSTTHGATADSILLLQGPSTAGTIVDGCCVSSPTPPIRGRDHAEKRQARASRRKCRCGRSRSAGGSREPVRPRGRDP
jgi:hypothetical protein